MKRPPQKQGIFPLPARHNLPNCPLDLTLTRILSSLNCSGLDLHFSGHFQSILIPNPVNFYTKYCYLRLLGIDS